MEIEEIKALESDREKILEGMKLVYKNLLAYKKKMNYDLVVLRDGKIIRVKAEELERLDRERELKERNENG